MELCIIQHLYCKHIPMAEITVPQKGGRRKLQAPRLDLTPMVDLGFILITFFIFTTTLSDNRAMQVVMPDNTPTERPQVVPEESTITLIPTNNHKVIWYEGALKSKKQAKTTSMVEVRSVLLHKKQVVAALSATFSVNAHKMYVLIKPADDCKYEDVVHLLDEMTITDVPLYCIVDVSPEEKEMLLKK